MNIKRVDHIGIAVPNLDDAIKFYEDILGIKCEGKETVVDQKVNVAFLPVGDTEIELLEGTDENSAIYKYIQKNSGRGGIQHIALNVESIESSIKEFKDKGYIMLDNTFRYGAGGAKIAFCHPKGTYGTLIELTER